MIKYKPYINLGPGDSIREEMEYYGWDEEKLRKKLGLTATETQVLLDNGRQITPQLAEKLSRLFKQSPQFWLNLDAHYTARINTKE